jgi:Resolvase, N terminal domain
MLSGADRSRPVLASLLRDIRAGETLVVVRFDHLARSVSDLLVVIEQFEAYGAYFRSLRGPIDTTTPQAMFSLQVLGAVARLERALIADRTKAGVRAARSRGRVGGNPGLRSGDPDLIRKVRASRDAAHLDGVLAHLRAERARDDRDGARTSRSRRLDVDAGQQRPSSHAYCDCSKSAPTAPWTTHWTENRASGGGGPPLPSSKSSSSSLLVFADRALRRVTKGRFRRLWVTHGA